VLISRRGIPGLIFGEAKSGGLPPARRQFLPHTGHLQTSGWAEGGGRLVTPLVAKIEMGRELAFKDGLWGGVIGDVGYAPYFGEFLRT